MREHLVAGLVVLVMTIDAFSRLNEMLKESSDTSYGVTLHVTLHVTASCVDSAGWRRLLP